MSLSGQTKALLQRRAAAMQAVRVFFAAREVVEVDTPLLAVAGNPEPNLANIQTLDGSYLQTSPEFAMKVLLSQGSGDIYQLGHVFRDEEQGRRHLREFMMLEWYRLGFNHHDLMLEVVDLMKVLIPRVVDYPVRYWDYDALFRQYLDLELTGLTDDDLRAFCVKRFVGSEHWDLTRDGYLDLLFSHDIQTNLGQSALDFVINYPPSQAALARLIEVGGQTKAARFELFIDGLELCNGFWELTDATEQAKRFAEENQRRVSRGLPEVAPDAGLLAALKRGLPDCAGVAVGFDRVLMLQFGVEDIRQVYG